MACRASCAILCFLQLLELVKGVGRLDGVIHNPSVSGTRGTGDEGVRLEYALVLVVFSGGHLTDSLARFAECDFHFVGIEIHDINLLLSITHD